MLKSPTCFEASSFKLSFFYTSNSILILLKHIFLTFSSCSFFYDQLFIPDKFFSFQKWALIAKFEKTLKYNILGAKLKNIFFL